MRCLLLAFLATPVWGEPQLRLPLDCAVGETCFIQHYVDDDPGPGAREFMGGPLTYDGHDGTDFRLRDLAALAEAPPVVAPADGTVRGTRDAVEDRVMVDRADVGDRECGNGVVIDHGDGWQTQLCHLARGSVRVAPGDRVTAGQPVGRVGLSGMTQFPHVHLSVRHDGAPVDPFVAELWAQAPAYRPGGLLSVGFAQDVPQFQVVKDGTAAAATLSVDAPALVIWGAMFGGRAGDVVGLAIAGPDGREVFATEVTLERAQAEAFRAAGRRPGAAQWPGGVYAGTVRLIRDGVEIDRLGTQVTLN